MILAAFAAVVLAQSDAGSNTELEAARARGLAKFGQLSDRVVARLPMPLPGPPWPSLAMGRLKIVRRANAVLVVTDGLSDEWDRSLHSDSPTWTFEIEIGVEVPLEMLKDTSDDGIARSWIPQLMWRLVDAFVPDRLDVKGLLKKFETVTFELDPIAGLERVATPRKTFGVLLGVPLVGSAVGSEAVLVPRGETDTIWLIGAKVLTPDEFEYALAVQGGEHGVELGNAFIARGDRHASWPKRPSVMPLLKKQRRRSP